MEKQIEIIDPHENVLNTYIWKAGNRKPKAVVQIIHGAGEHTGRYKEFAEYLNTLGYLVIGNDHLGHGKTADTNDYVHFSDENGIQKVYDGIIAVRDYIEQKYPSTPVIMFAHSMGSFFGRYTLLHDSGRYDQAIFTGTGIFNTFKVRFATLLFKIVAKLKGKTHISPKLTTMFTEGAIKSMKKNGLINKKVEWLTGDSNIRRAFIEDPMCGKPFTVGAQLDLFKLIPQIQDKKRIKEGASSTAIFFISGELDGLGEYGLAAKTLYNEYNECGYTNVKFTILNNCFHEVINDIEREFIYEMIGDWIKTNLDI